MNPRHLAALLIAGLMSGSLIPAVLSAGSAPDGKALFHNYCAPCHGKEGAGKDADNLSGGWREDGSRIAPALNGTAHTWHHGPDLLYEYVKEGSPDPGSPMPSFGDELKDDQIWSIIRYFQSLWPERIRRIYLDRFPGGMGEGK